jgi:uncharacterized protein
LCPKPQKGLDLPTCFFATDLHGKTDRYDKLLASIIRHVPAAVFLGGDLLPRSALSPMQFGQRDFVHDYLVPAFTRTRDTLGVHYPDVFVILGNDDPRRCEEDFVAASADGLWHYVHEKKCLLGDFAIYGLGYVPPTPCLLKDWERYDVSRYVSPGCVSPEEGSRTVPTEESEIKWATIQKDLASLVGEDPLDRTVLLLHTPPCDTPLDRAALDWKTYEHVPVDVHVGSIAVKRFIEERQPLLTLHGHIHEAARLSGEWKIRINRSVCINGAHDGPELALVRFDLKLPEAATRDLL